jgi:hypothetical protein
MSSLTPSPNFESLAICVIWLMAISQMYFDLGKELLKFKETDIFSKVSSVSEFENLREENWKNLRYLMMLCKVYWESKRWEVVQKYFIFFVLTLLILIVIFMLSERTAAEIAWVKWISTISLATMTLAMKWRIWVLNCRINRV